MKVFRSRIGLLAATLALLLLPSGIRAESTAEGGSPALPTAAGTRGALDASPVSDCIKPDAPSSSASAKEWAKYFADLADYLECVANETGGIGNALGKPFAPRERTAAFLAQRIKR